MEVHHHSHTSRKKWTHYFWEFFMLFLAVFCGFLAEYQLEHKIEKERAQQYMNTLLTDLKNDSLNLAAASTENTVIEKGLDSLLVALHQGLDDQRSVNQLYFLYAKYGQNITSVHFNEGTTTQLKNAGGLRLIKDNALAV